MFKGGEWVPQYYAAVPTLYKALIKTIFFNLANDSHFNREGIPSGKYADEVLVVAESSILESSPTVCLLAAKLEEKYYKNIETVFRNASCAIELRPSGNFKSLEKIEDLKMLDYDSITLLNDLLFNSSLAASITAGSVSCLLSFLDASLDEGQNSMSSSLSVMADRYHYSMIHRIETLQLKERLFLDEESLRALHIFPPLRKTGQDVLVKNGYHSIFGC